MDHEGLRRLEEIVEKLLLQYTGLKQEKEKLQYDLMQKNLEIRELREMTMSLQEEKNLIYERVSSLITSLEKWEEAQIRPSEPANHGEMTAEGHGLNLPKSSEGLGVGA
jgi:hypothetical protein